MEDTIETANGQLPIMKIEFPYIAIRSLQTSHAFQPTMGLKKHNVIQWKEGCNFMIMSTLLGQTHTL